MDQLKAVFQVDMVSTFTTVHSDETVQIQGFGLNVHFEFGTM